MSARKKKDEHVIMKAPDTMACLHCGQRYRLDLPADVDIVTAIEGLHQKARALSARRSRTGVHSLPRVRSRVRRLSCDQVWGRSQAMVFGAGHGDIVDRDLWRDDGLRLLGKRRATRPE